MKMEFTNTTNASIAGMKNLKKYNFFLLLIFTMIFVCVINPDLLKFQKVCRVQLSAVYDDSVSHGQELCLSNIVVSHEEVPISTLKIEKTQGWEYADDFDDYIFYPQERAADNILVLRIETPGDIELVFTKSIQSGSVKITTQGENAVIDLYSETTETDSYIIEENNFTYAYWDKIIQWIGLFVLISILVSIIDIILKKASLINKLSFVCCILSFYILNKYDLLNGLTIIFLVSCLLHIIYTDRRTYQTESVGKEFTFSRLVLHAYFVFVLIANRIFMTEALMKFGVAEIGSFAVVTLALLPFGTILLFIFDKCQKYIAKSKAEITHNQIKKVRMVCFIITFSILILMTLGFYPALMARDSASHWIRAVGYDAWKIRDDTSGAYTILLRLCSKIWYSPYCMVMLQLFLFSFISARVLAYFCTKGIPVRITYVLSAVIAVLPNNFTTLSVIKTNPMYTILCIWVTYLLIKLIENPEKAGMSVGFIAEMGIALPCLYLCRHNSFLAVYVTCIILIFMFIKYAMQHKKLKVNFLIPILLTIIIVKTVTGPIYTYFDVIRDAPKLSDTVYPLISPLAVAYNNGIELTEDTLEYMNRIRPLEYWGNHNRYNGDTFYWSDPRLQFDQTSVTEIFKYYFKLFFSRPDIVIKDRLDAIESLWNVFPSMGEGAYNRRYRLGIDSLMPMELLPANWRNITELNQGSYRHDTAFTTIPYALCQLCETSKTLDPLIFRAGFSIILVLYALYYACITGQKKKSIAAIPMLGTLVTLILAVNFQIYQYFWVIHIVNWLLVFYFILPTDSQ